MTCTNKQVGILMNKIKKHNQIIAAAKAGMNVKTARKYLRKTYAILFSKYGKDGDLSCCCI